MVKVTSLLAKAGSGFRFSFRVRAWTEMEIHVWCVKGMSRLKLVSSENNSVFKGLRLLLLVVVDYLLLCVYNKIWKVQSNASNGYKAYISTTDYIHVLATFVYSYCLPELQYACCIVLESGLTRSLLPTFRSVHHL